MTYKPNQSIGGLPVRQSGKVLKLAIDVHLEKLVVAMQEDGDFPKSPQRFTQLDFLSWVKKRIRGGWRVVTCYEAGPFGYGLHRSLTSLGAHNLVIRARNWDDHDRRIKTDSTDASSMLSALDRYLAGNTHALAVIRVPSEKEEQQRSQSRLRQNLARQLRRMAQRGRGLALEYGHRLKGRWYGPRQWPRWKTQLPAHLVELLETIRLCLEPLMAQIQQLRENIQKSVDYALPLGMGRQTAAELDREICDWNRFHNRRQVAGWTGLTPCEHSSGNSRFQGSVTKTGNARVRWMLCETAWRLMRYQPRYHRARKWLRTLARNNGRRRKQIVVALARGFAVDWWRIRTGRTTPEKLGLKMVPPSKAENQPLSDGAESRSRLRLG